MLAELQEKEWDPILKWFNERCVFISLFTSIDSTDNFLYQHCVVNYGLYIYYRSNHIMRNVINAVVVYYINKLACGIICTFIEDVKIALSFIPGD